MQDSTADKLGDNRVGQTGRDGEAIPAADKRRLAGWRRNAGHRPGAEKQWQIIQTSVLWSDQLPSTGRDHELPGGSMATDSLHHAVCTAAGDFAYDYS